jgi:hypothetical protein
VSPRSLTSRPFPRSGQQLSSFPTPSNAAVNAAYDRSETTQVAQLPAEIRASFLQLMDSNIEKDKIISDSRQEIINLRNSNLATPLNDHPAESEQGATTGGQTFNPVDPDNFRVRMLETSLAMSEERREHLIAQTRGLRGYVEYADRQLETQAARIVELEEVVSTLTRNLSESL